MTNKILTISIASYNVSKFISNTLKSLVGSKYINELDILVIDDGAKDDTLEVAKPYAERFPDSIRLIHKENGGYGTVVNKGIELAKGKYFKLLDGDDWFETSGLDCLIEDLKKSEADIFVTKMYESYPDQNVLYKDTWDDLVGQTVELKNLQRPDVFGMWEIACKTSLLRENVIKFPEKTLYTDHLYIMIALASAKTLSFKSYPVYCYRLGYDEQSVSTTSRLKHVDDIKSVSSLVNDFYIKNSLNNDSSCVSLERCLFCYREALKTILLKKWSIKNYKELKRFENDCKNNYLVVYENIKKGGRANFIKFIRSLGFVGYTIVKIKNKIKK